MKVLLLLCFLLINRSNLLTTNLSYDYSTIQYISKNEDLTSKIVTSTNPDETAVYITSEAKSSIIISKSIINKESGDSSNI